jgi:hypothetical protein
MKYRDKNGKFCSKEKWEEAQKKEKKGLLPLPTLVTVGILCVIIVYEVWSVGITGWWK